MPRLILFSGYAQSGKDTAADFLCIEHKYHKFKFAQPLYDMLCAMYKDVIPHISQKYIELHKNHKMPFSQKTWRQGLQTLGTEWGRNIIAKDIWEKSISLGEL